VGIMAGRALQPALALIIATAEHEALGWKADGGFVCHDLAKVARGLPMALSAKPQLFGSTQFPWVPDAVSNGFPAANHLNMFAAGSMTSFALDSGARLLNFFRNRFRLMGDVATETSLTFARVEPAGQRFLSPFGFAEFGARREIQELNPLIPTHAALTVSARLIATDEGNPLPSRTHAPNEVQLFASAIFGRGQVKSKFRFRRPLQTIVHLMLGVVKGERDLLQEFRNLLDAAQCLSMIAHGMNLCDLGMAHGAFVGTDVFPLDRESCSNENDHDANTNNREPGLSLHVF
jgi:hypothetical protein